MMPNKSFLLSAVFLLLVACGSEKASSSAGSSESAGGATSSANDSVATFEADRGWPDDPMKIRLPMGFIPDPQYAPFYVALEKGYFSEAGFEVEFDYSFETDGLALVGAGEVPFAIVSGEQVILARAQDIPVVYILEWFQRFPIAVISKAERGIEKTTDLLGRQIGIPGLFGASYVGLAGLLSANNLTLEDVEPHDIGFTQVESLLTDQVEAVVGYANNEPLQLEALGEEINVIFVADEADLVANGLIANEEIISENPEVVEAFVRATLRGIDYTLKNPAEAFEISKLYVEGLDDSRMSVLNASIDMWQADVLGMTDEASWIRTQEALLQIGFLDEAVDDLKAAFTNDFILDNLP